MARKRGIPTKLFGIIAFSLVLALCFTPLAYAAEGADRQVFIEENSVEAAYAGDPSTGGSGSGAPTAPGPPANDPALSAEYESRDEGADPPPKGGGAAAATSGSAGGNGSSPESGGSPESDGSDSTQIVKPLAVVSYSGTWANLQGFIQNQTADGDTVIINPDPAVLGTVNTTVFVTKNITITGSNPDTPIVMRNTTTATRHFDTDAGTSNTLTLQNITLDGNRQGGGVNCNAPYDTLILGNGATIQNCSTFQDWEYGGAITGKGTVRLQSGSLITGNRAGNGAGVHLFEGAELTVEPGATLSNNTAVQNGGAICAGTIEGVAGAANKVARVTLNGGLITGNRASFGGGIFTQSTLVMNGGTISNNTADMGGGIYTTLTGVVDLQATMLGGSVEGNTAQWGGGIALWASLQVAGPNSIEMLTESVSLLATTAVVAISGGNISGNTATGSATGGPNAAVAVPGYDPSIRGPGGSGGGIYTYRYEYLSVGPEAVFANNTAPLAVPERNPAQDAVYASNILHTQWSTPFTQGYNNYDINHLHTKTIKVTYVDERGVEIAEAVSLTGYVGDRYTSTQKTIAGYTFKEVRGEASGVFAATPQEVVYVYSGPPAPPGGGGGGGGGDERTITPSSTPGAPGGKPLPLTGDMPVGILLCLLATAGVLGLSGGAALFLAARRRRRRAPRT